MGRPKRVALGGFIYHDFIAVCRYVERNPLRAGLVGQAEDWKWGSLWKRVSGKAGHQEQLAEWPVARPQNWLSLVNHDDLKEDKERGLTALRNCVNRGCPFGSEQWLGQVIGELGLQSTIRPRGRPRREKGS